MPLHELLPMLQVAIGPVIMISGIGLLMLSMTNRFARVIDRSRQLITAKGGDQALLRNELDVLTRRAGFIRRAILMATISLLSVAIMIIVIFLAGLLRWDYGIPVAVLFIACMACLIGSLLEFLADINLSVTALELERTAWEKAS